MDKHLFSNAEKDAWGNDYAVTMRDGLVYPADLLWLLLALSAISNIKDDCNFCFLSLVTDSMNMQLHIQILVLLVKNIKMAMGKIEGMCSINAMFTMMCLI